MSRMLADAATAEIRAARCAATRALTGDPERADDLVQDCLERAWTRQHHYDGSSELRPWLFHDPATTCTPTPRAAITAGRPSSMSTRWPRPHRWPREPRR